MPIPDRVNADWIATLGDDQLPRRSCPEDQDSPAGVAGGQLPLEPPNQPNAAEPDDGQERVHHEDRARV